MRGVVVLVLFAALGCESSKSPAPPEPPPPPPAPAVIARPPPPPLPRPSKKLRDALALDGPNAPTAVDPRETVRFAVDTLREIIVYRVESGVLTLEARTPLEGYTMVHGLVWANPKELVVQLYNHGEIKFLVFRDGAFKPLAMPAEKLFAPTISASKHGADRLFASQSGEVWWDHCLSRAEPEPHRCTKHGSVRVFPEATVASRPPVERPPITTLVPPPPCPDLDLAKAEWLSLQPPVARLADADDYMYFVVGCKQLETFAHAAMRGPRGFWAIQDEAENIKSRHAVVVLWHTRTVGVVADGDSVFFSP